MNASSTTNTPFLSILVPAYNYAEGVHRILTRLHPLPIGDCEIIIFDDSIDNGVDEVVRNRCEATGSQVTYQHNYLPFGAAANWNALLDAAQGEYCLLLHHDEFPLMDDFISNVIQALCNDRALDVLILDCILISPSNGCNRRHLPMWLRALVVNQFPQYLFRRNVIGPTSTLVVRRTLFPRFDTRLRWYIDVDLYVRLFKVAKKIRLCPEVKIGSIMGRAESITAGLQSSMPQIVREERTYLRDVHQATCLWLEPLQYRLRLRSMILIFETICWNSFRGIGRIIAAFCFGPVPRSIARQAITVPSSHERKL